VRYLVEADPALSGGATFEMPHRTYCFRAALPRR
jgi:hypothetical protein